MRKLYFDCFSGASGNMILGALIAAGIDAGVLEAELRELGLPEFELVVEKVDRSGISSFHVHVEIPDEKKHRHLAEIEGIIEESTLSGSIKERAISIFRRLAEAEAAVHGIALEKVHFHEVGALDAIIDIVGACIGFELLGIESFAASKLNVGSGFVRMAHGNFPVPPPAVVELLKGAPVYATEIEGELLTPTGAAIISTLCDSYGPIAEILPDVIGYGAGTRSYEDFPNVLRILVGESAERSENELLSLLETNIDDLSPQILGHFMDLTLEAGALDCWFTSIQMKKNRPAAMVSVLCRTADTQRFLEMFYRETSTLGVRLSTIQRNFLERRVSKVETEFGEISVKTGYFGGAAVNQQAEFDEVRMAAAAAGVPVKQVAEAAVKKIREGE